MKYLANDNAVMIVRPITGLESGIAYFLVQVRAIIWTVMPQERRDARLQR